MLTALSRRFTSGVPEVVAVASRASHGQDVVGGHHGFRPPIPVPKLGVQPPVVLAPYLSLCQVRLGRVERNHLGLPLSKGHTHRERPGAEEVLEVAIAYVLGVVVTHDDYNVGAL